MEISLFVRKLKRRSGLVFFITIVVAVLVFVVSILPTFKKTVAEPSFYRANASVLIYPSEDEDDMATIFSNFAAVCSHDIIKDRVSDYLKEDMRPYWSTLFGVDIYTGGNTATLYWKGYGEENEVAGVLDVILANVIDLSQQLLPIEEINIISHGVSFVPSAIQPSGPSIGDIIKYALFGILVGGVVALLVAILLDYLNNKVDDAYLVNDVFKDIPVFNNTPDQALSLLRSYCLSQKINRLVFVDFGHDVELQQKVNQEMQQNNIEITQWNDTGIVSSGEVAILNFWSHSVSLSSALQTKKELDLFQVQPVLAIWWPGLKKPYKIMVL